MEVYLPCHKKGDYSQFETSSYWGNPNTISFEFIKYVWQFPENNNEFIKLQQLKTQDHIKWVISNSSSQNLE